MFNSKLNLCFYIWWWGGDVGFRQFCLNIKRNDNMKHETFSNHTHTCVVKTNRIIKIRVRVMIHLECNLYKSVSHQAK